MTQPDLVTIASETLTAAINPHGAELWSLTDRAGQQWMTDADPATVTAALHKLKALAQAAGCKLEEPFLQLSFLALPVIPALKITDRGLVDVTTFQRVPVLL